MTAVFDDPATEVDPSSSEPSVSGFTHVTAVSRPTDRQIIGHTLLILVLLLFGAQAGYFGAGLLEERFEAISEVEYRGNSWTETQDVAIRSRTLTLPVAEFFGIAITDFEKDLGAGLVPGTQILRISYVDSDPALALEIVSEMTDRYVTGASELPPPDSTEAIKESLETLAEDLDLALTELEQLPDDPARPGLTVEQQTKQGQIATIRDRISVLELRVLDDGLEELDILSSGVPRVTTNPFVFEEPVEPRPVLLGVVGAAAGLLLGSAVMAWRWSRIAWRGRDDQFGAR